MSTVVTVPSSALGSLKRSRALSPAQTRPGLARLISRRSVAVYSRSRSVVFAQKIDEDDDDFEKRLSSFSKVPKSKAPAKDKGKKTTATGLTKLPEEDLPGEVELYSGPPSRGDLAVNVALGATLLWLPLTMASVGRALWVNYRITNKRVVVKSTPPVGASEDICAAIEDVVDVKAIGRGVGAWGDMCLTLKDGSKVEIRSVDNWMDIKNEIQAQIDAKTSADNVEISLDDTPVAEKAQPKGF